VRLLAGTALCIGLAGCATLPSDSANADTDPPPRCDPSMPWTYAAAGREIFCGVHADGCAECWGDEPVADTGWDTGGGFFDRGQFEVPDLALSTVSVMAAHVGASQNDTVCGTTTDGGALCWGRKSAQLPRSYRYTRVDPGGACAARVGGGVDCDPDWGTPPDSVDVAVAMNVVVVLRSDGELWMREDDYGFTVVDLGTPPYSAVDVMTPYHRDTAVFVLCAVHGGDGSLDCWNPTDDVGRTGEVIDTVPPGAYTTVCLTADDHACALDEAGYPTCWGAGPMGEPVEPLSQLSCGYSDACGVTVDGRLLCWGACDHGECEVPG